MTEKIKAALAQLNVDNDNHWTADGSPRIETLRMLTGTPSLTRDEVVKADQSFTRDSVRKAKEAETAKHEGDKRVLGETSMAQNVDALGHPSGTPSEGMPPPDGAKDNSAAPGELVGPDGTTANPNAESDNQLGTGDPLDAEAQQLLSDEMELKEQIAAGEDYLAQLTAKRDELDLQVRTVTTQLDSLKNRLKSDEPDHRTNMANIQAYLRSSQEKRDARAELAREDGAGKKHVPAGAKEKLDQKLESRPRNPSGQAGSLK